MDLLQALGLYWRPPHIESISGHSRSPSTGYRLVVALSYKLQRTWSFEPPQNMPNRSGSPLSLSLVRFSCIVRKFHSERFPPCLHGQYNA